ncbi:MAG TPA: DUF1810 domain-containing protein [Allosphingosinicella sp.]|nr:DUF1810 domain-containing protein [Allosphingosinicella sp.]
MAGFELERFVEAQAPIYGRALAELRQGRKESHWMWFVFPQVAGLGTSPMARRYAIASADEARAYLAHPLLGARLRDCTAAILAHRERSAEAIFGAVDAMKLRSSMTLFEAVAGDPAPFAAALAAFHGGERDAATLRLIGR